jgi:hypothetical protein
MTLELLIYPPIREFWDAAVSGTSRACGSDLDAYGVLVARYTLPAHRAAGRSPDTSAGSPSPSSRS